MKVVELSEAVTLPPDAIERLNGLLIKPLRDTLIRRMEYPNLYYLMDTLDDVISDRKYAKSPRRKQAIELLFPYVAQALDEIIKNAKADGSQFPYPRIIKLLRYSIDNDAIAEVLENNKDKLLKILKAFIDKTHRSAHNVGRSADESAIVDIVNAFDHAGIDWIELKQLYKQHFLNRYNSWLSQPQDKWGTDTVFNVLNDMARHRLTLDDLDEELANRLRSMKSILLNRSLFNLKHDSIRYGMVETEEYYKKLRRLGFDWPELQLDSTNYTALLDRFKTPIMRAVLTLFKEQHANRAANVIAELKKSVDWPELAAMERSLNAKQLDEVAEEIHPARIKSIDESLKYGDYIGAAHYMGVYGINIDDLDPKYRQRYEDRKTDIIMELLQVIRNIDLYRSYRLVDNVRKSGLGWSELDTMYKSLNKSYSEKYR